MTENEAMLWGPAIGAGIAFLAVGLQLLYDSWQRGRERKWNSRMDIYLHAAEGSARQASFLANYAFSKLEDPETRASLREVAGWLNKVNVVASAETVEKLADAEVEYCEVLAPCSLLKFDAMAIQQASESTTNLITTWQKAIQQNHSKLAEDLRTNAHLVNEEVLSLFEEHNRELQEQISEGLNENAQRAEHLKKKQLDLIKASRDAHLRYLRKLVAVNLAIRAELKLSIDKQRFENAMRRVFDAGERAQVQLAAHIEKVVDAQEPA